MPEYADDLDLLSLVTQGLALEDLVVLDRDVRVANWVVQIAGKVRTLADRRRARRLIGEIAGVRDIKDYLQVDQTLFRNLEARRQNSTGR